MSRWKGQPLDPVRQKPHVKIVVTADLHLELTGREPIRRMIASIAHERPAALVIAGDVGNPSPLFGECLSEFMRLNVPTVVLAGNHDVWIGHDTDSDKLFRETLPAMTTERGFFWLDGEQPFSIGDVGIAGSMAWYDYSARDQARGHSDEEILAMKPKFAMDAVRVNWKRTDQEVAAECRARLAGQLAALRGNPGIKKILVVTHVPIFENQMDRRPDDDHWSLGNPYFGHFTMGEQVRPDPLVRWVVSGHTHVGMNGLVERDGMAPIATGVISSDYHKPRYVVVDTDQ